MQPAYLVAAFCAIGWLVQFVWGRATVARLKADIDAEWEAAERDRNDAIAKAVALEKQLATANADIDARAKSFYELERAAKRDAEALLAAKKTIDDLKARNAAAVVKLQGELDAYSARLKLTEDQLTAAEDRLSGVLAELRENLTARKPAPWKALAARLTKEVAA